MTIAIVLLLFCDYHAIDERTKFTDHFNKVAEPTLTLGVMSCRVCLLASIILYGPIISNSFPWWAFFNCKIVIVIYEFRAHSNVTYSIDVPKIYAWCSLMSTQGDTYEISELNKILLNSFIAVTQKFMALSKKPNTSPPVDLPSPVDLPPPVDWHPPVDYHYVST